MLVSRMVREPLQRLLIPKGVWKVKTQARQQRMVKKRTKILENISAVTNERGEAEEGQQDLAHYLAKLFMPLIA